MWGAAISAVANIGGSILANRQMKKAERNLQRQQDENENLFNQRYNESALQRADTMRLMNRVSEDIRNRNQQAAGTAAVMGGTAAAVAATKEANNAALASTAGNVIAANEARKDQIENNYQNRKAELDKQQNEMLMNKAKNIKDAANGLAAVGNAIQNPASAATNVKQ